jgi:hypothetical protein
MSKQLINVGTGELTGDGETLRSAFVKINNNFDEVYSNIDAINVPTDVGQLTNSIGYITTASIPVDVSAFNNDVGYLTTSTLPPYPVIPTNVSEFENNVGYLTSGTVNDYVNSFTVTNVSYFNNDAGYLTTSTNPDILGNLEVNGTILQTIAGTVADGDITLAPNGTGTVRAPSLTLPVGSLVEKIASIEAIIEDLTLDTVVDYSTGTGDTLVIGTIGNTTGYAHPWAIYKFTTTPDPALEVNDVIAGAAVPLNSTISFVGTGTYDKYIVTDKVFPLGVPVDGALISIARPVVNASLSISTDVDTNIELDTGGGLGVIVTHSDIVPFTNNTESLGTPTKRFKQLWLGGGTIFIADDVLGIDLSIAARNGDLVVEGGAGLEVGQFVFRDNEMRITDPNTEIFIGQIGAPAPVTFRRTIRVRNVDDSHNLLDVDQQGRITVLSAIAADPTQAAMSIVGARARDVKSPDNLGVLLQLTGSSTAPSRIYHDSYGAGNYSAFIGRKARGSSTTSTQTLSGDIISRIGANPHDEVGFASISTMRMDFVNAEDQTTAARGGKIEFWTTPIGSTTIGKRVTIDGSDIVLTALGNGGVKFQDSTRQTTAWTGTVAYSNVTGTPTNISSFYNDLDYLQNNQDNGTIGGIQLYNNQVIFADTTIQTTAWTGTIVTSQITNLSQGAVTKIVAGNGITVSTSTGEVGIDATGVQTTVGTTNQIIVTDSGAKNLTLSLPQSINTTASVTFQNITVNNLTILGTSTVATTLAIEGKIIYLATSATDISQIDGGGIQLGTSTFAKSILYSNNDNWWDTDGAGLKTLHLNATTATIDTLNVAGTAHFGTSYLGYDFANAEIQADANINSFAQIVIKNHNTGTSASTDLVATNDIGDDTANFIDVGILSSAYTDPGWTIGTGNDGYLYINGGNLTIGTDTPDKIVKFHTGGTLEENIRAVITDVGMDVVGGFTAATVNGYTLPNTATTAGYVLSNDGTGITSWIMPQTGFVGSRGTIGYTGSTGTQGVIGYTGSTGTQGLVGYTGSTGTQGLVGYTGSTGTQGVIGYTGSTGTQGVIGYTGSTGTQGVVGYTGSTGTQGVIGYTGSTGTQGVIGYTGSTGTQGVIGYTGSTGTQGVIGYTGSTGTQGVIGYTGSTGTQGVIGYTGSTGTQGVIGYTGSKGVADIYVSSITGGNNIVLSTSTGAVSITRIDGSQNVVTGNSTATYTILTTDQYFGSTRSTVGGCTVTLPLGSAVPVGRQYVIKDEGGQSGTFGRRITLTAAGSDTIDGSATRTITSNYGSLTVLWTGTRWSVI